jgi:hypothetical protein
MLAHAVTTLAVGESTPRQPMLFFFEATITSMKQHVAGMMAAGTISTV